MKGAILFLLVALAPLAAQGNDPNTPEGLAARILSEPSLSTKKDLGRRLGRLAKPGAKEALLGLLEAESYWDRLAAVAGLAGTKDPAAIAALSKKYVSDHMIRDAIAPLAVGDAAAWSPALIACWEEAGTERGRPELLALLGQLPGPESPRFLESLARDPGEPLAAPALRALVSSRSERVGLARELAPRAKLRTTALALVVEGGNRDDLPAFVRILADTNETDEARVLACQAVAKWAPDDAKAAACLAALKQGREGLAQGALLAFRGLRDEAVIDEACRLCRRGRLQRTRLLAAEALLEVHQSRAIPYLIETLQETWSPDAAPVGIEIAAAVLTAGLSTIFEKIGSASSRSEFAARQERIIQTLAKDTGAWPGKTYAQWRDWAILAGYTVGGSNLLQWLFSPDPAKRRAAMDAAARILGHRDLAAFQRADPARIAIPEAQLRLELAGKLQEAGFLKDEP